MKYILLRSLIRSGPVNECTIYNLDRLETLANVPTTDYSLYSVGSRIQIHNFKYELFKSSFLIFPIPKDILGT